MKTFPLGSLQIPVIGLGTWQLTGDTCTRAVEIALEMGYRHIDTAAAYSNHLDIAKGLKATSIPRNEIFITSKVWRTDMAKQKTLDAAQRALNELEVDYLDLYLMHWPDRSIPLEETLTAFLELQAQGLIKEWGVSNCNVHHLQDILDRGYQPANNQVEFHPSLNQRELKDFCDKNNIRVTAYSPIAQGEDLSLPVVQELALKYERSESQVILNWLIAKGVVAIPKASNREHLEDNFQVINWEMEAEDVARMDALNTDNRLIIPGWADFEY